MLLIIYYLYTAENVEDRVNTKLTVLPTHPSPLPQDMGAFILILPYCLCKLLFYSPGWDEVGENL